MFEGRGSVFKVGLKSSKTVIFDDFDHILMVVGGSVLGVLRECW